MIFLLFLSVNMFVFEFENKDDHQRCFLFRPTKNKRDLEIHFKVLSAVKKNQL